MFRCCAGCSKYLMLLFIAAVCRHFPSSWHPQFGPRHWACAGNPEAAQPSWSFRPSGANRSKQLTDGAKLELETGNWPSMLTTACSLYHFPSKENVLRERPRWLSRSWGPSSHSPQPLGTLLCIHSSQVWDLFADREDRTLAQDRLPSASDWGLAWRRCLVKVFDG